MHKSTTIFNIYFGILKDFFIRFDFLSHILHFVLHLYTDWDNVEQFMLLLF